jgi:hypothetical protein
MFVYWLKWSKVAIGHHVLVTAHINMPVFDL